MNSHESTQSCGCDAGAQHLCERHANEVRAWADGAFTPTAAAACNPHTDEYREKFRQIALLLESGRSAMEKDYDEAMAAAESEWTKAAAPTRPVGIGGAPTRATTLPKDARRRKEFPIASGFMDYFPDAIAAIAHLSFIGNEQHNPGQPLHWDRSKSGDESDTMLRHFLERGTFDTDNVRHSVKMAWRALAILQKELEQEKQ